MRREQLAIAAFAVLAAAFWPGTALAGPVEQMVQVALHPTDPQLMVVRYAAGGGGMIRSADGGKSWQLLCDAALSGSEPNSVGAILISGTGTTIRAAYNGLFEDMGGGCEFHRTDAYAGEWIADLAPDPSDPSISFAVTSAASTMTERKLNGVLRREANGTWHDLGAREELLATRLHVVRTRAGGLRFYVSAIRGQLAAADGGVPRPNYVVRVSDDEGRTWTEHAYGTTDGTFRLQGVDPSDPDRLIATISRTRESGQPSASGNDSVLVSTDQGAHFSEYLTITEIGAVTFAPDGRVWIGDAGDTSDASAPKGLWFANSLAEPARKLAQGDYPVQCLAYQSATSTLFACQHFWFGNVADDGSFETRLKLNEVKEFVACDGSDTAAACQTQLCGAYCGFGHFAVAPVCGAYDVPDYCGVAVQQIEDPHPELGVSRSASPQADAGLVRDVALAGAAGSSANSGPATGSPKQAARSKTPELAPTGCSAMTPGDSRSPPHALSSLLLLALALLALALIASRRLRVNRA